MLLQHPVGTSETEISVISDTGFTMEVYGISYLKCVSSTGDIGKQILEQNNILYISILS